MHIKRFIYLSKPKQLKTTFLGIVGNAARVWKSPEFLKTLVSDLEYQEGRIDELEHQAEMLDASDAEQFIEDARETVKWLREALKKSEQRWSEVDQLRRDTDEVIKQHNLERQRSNTIIRTLLDEHVDIKKRMEIVENNQESTEQRIDNVLTRLENISNFESAAAEHIDGNERRLAKLEAKQAQLDRLEQIEKYPNLLKTGGK